MAEHDSARPANNSPLSGPAVLLAAVFSLPVLIPSLFSWGAGLLAIPVLYTLRVHGLRQGSIYLRNGLVVSLMVAIGTGELGMELLVLSLVPLGYSLYRSTIQGESPVAAGGRGVFVLGLTWFILWAIYGMTQGVNPYRHLVEMLDAGFAQTYEAYRQSTELSPEMLLALKEVVDDIRMLIPRVLPGVLACSLLLTVWLNLVAGSRILRRLHPEFAPWPPYSKWQLPDRLVWGIIGAGLLILVGRGFIRDLGTCLALVMGLLYFFQGLAVVVFLLDRWKVPGYLRMVLYIILIVQSYGLLLVAMLGLADVWLDFRKFQTPPADEHQNT
ncbi:hypothetical protein GF1_13720 [Desulfolithobacter dissulfuricans]|uniref:DUF2232 domain-containing protein n=1 Tax=Desulfolithobacter dissulfuricans TaxID=2795293 RepID=A0A915XL09_9BACT|nr:DUF2232 domain-containing protein [Desulfolithobacter dissulfuricans]BCO08996.1 hypothetical protein GF1_13720 [Desulfolithobacter dissulfuricans]